MSALRAVDGAVARVERGVAVALLAITVALVILQVFFRYVPEQLAELVRGGGPLPVHLVRRSRILQLGAWRAACSASTCSRGGCRPRGRCRLRGPVRPSPPPAFSGRW